MPTTNLDLQSLTKQLLEEVKKYGILDVSLPQYETVCRSIINFAGYRFIMKILLDNQQAAVDHPHCIAHIFRPF